MHFFHCLTLHGARVCVCACTFFFCIPLCLEVIKYLLTCNVRARDGRSSFMESAAVWGLALSQFLPKDQHQHNISTCWETLPSLSHLRTREASFRTLSLPLASLSSYTSFYFPYNGGNCIFLWIELIVGTILSEKIKQ